MKPIKLRGSPLPSDCRVRITTLFLLLLFSFEANAKVSTRYSVLYAHLLPETDTLEIAYKEATSDYHCPLLAHGCTQKAISAYLYGISVPITDQTLITLSSAGPILLREAKLDNSFVYNQWLNRTHIRLKDMETLETCYFASDADPCVPSEHQAGRILEELIDPHHVDASGTLVFSGNTLYSLPELEPLGHFATKPGYQNFVALLRENFDTGETFYDVGIFPINQQLLLGIPDFIHPHNETLAFYYNITEDRHYPVPVDFALLRDRFEGEGIGFKIREFRRTESGLMLYIEVIVYGQKVDGRWQKGRRHYGVFDVAKGKFAEISLRGISILDYHILDTQRNRVIRIAGPITDGITVEYYPYQF
jgi:hypothetical protein